MIKRHRELRDEKILSLLASGLAAKEVALKMELTSAHIVYECVYRWRLNNEKKNARRK